MGAQHSGNDGSPLVDHFPQPGRGGAMRFLIAAALGAAMLPSVAAAEEREYCPDRPGIAAPACTVPQGTFSLEVGAGDWTLDRNSEEREDVFTTAELLVRYGVAEHAEVQLGRFRLVAHARPRDG